MDFFEDFDPMGYDDFVGSNDEQYPVSDEEKAYDPSGITTPDEEVFNNGEY